MPESLKHKAVDEVLSNKAQYLLLIFCLTVGIAAGIISVGNIGSAAKSSLAADTVRMMNAVRTQSAVFLDVLIRAWLWCSALYVCIAFFALLMIGLPMIAVLMIYKGFCIGFTAGLLSMAFGSGGGAALLFGLLLPCVVLVPCVCKAGVMGWNHSLCVIRRRHIPQTPGDRLSMAVPFYKKLIRVYGAAQIGVLMQAALCPLLMSLFA